MIPRKVRLLKHLKALETGNINYIFVWVKIGDENGISELAAVLGFKYKKEPDGSFSHSNIINVLDENGIMAYQHFGLNQDV